MRDSGWEKIVTRFIQVRIKIEAAAAAAATKIVAFLIVPESVTTVVSLNYLHVLFELKQG